jgi:hypothetical protein
MQTSLVDMHAKCGVVEEAFTVFRMGFNGKERCVNLECYTWFGEEIT